VPFIRYTRDKRGYETTYVMHGYRQGQGSGRTRVLYLFRSPAHIKIGRKVLDEEAREGLAHTHPDLSFDWTSLARETPAPRYEEPAPRYQRRPDRPERERGERPRAESPSPSTSAPAPMVIDDQTLLGRTLGAAEAGSLRQRYADLIQRIARRARTPEDRDRLTERVQRLNPDEWPDEAAVRSNAQSIGTEWDAIAAELPHRRRGRRGGRRRQPGQGRPDEPSVIIEDGGDANAGPENDEARRSDWGADAAGEHDADRPAAADAAPSTGQSPEPDVPDDGLLRLEHGDRSR